MQIDAALIQRYDSFGPRYTSYPTAAQFTEQFDEASFRRMAAESNDDPLPVPLSVYVHIPFCESLCYYCGCNKKVTHRPEVVAAYLSRLHREIALQSELFDEDRTVEQLHFGGGTPTYLEHSQLEALIEQLGHSFNLDRSQHREWSIEIDPRTMGPEGMEALGATGFTRVSLGVQDFDPHVQEAVNRIQPYDLTRALIDRARTLGFRGVSVDLIYGLPCQSVASFDATLDKVIALRPSRLSLYSYAHLPHLFKAQRLIREEDLPSPTEKLEIFRHAVARLTESDYVYIGMDHFALPDDDLTLAQRDGTLQRNFQGYSTHADCDLIGVGVSSISKVAHCYSQNAKDIRDYQKRIDSGHLPVVRGVELNADDWLRRDVIHGLMCQGRVDFATLESRHDIHFRSCFADELGRLSGFEQDGLLKVRDDGMEITPLGKFFMRNIAMTFDAYLPRENVSRRFSRTI